MKIIFGLGNPGDSYSKNRHNLGFMILDQFAGLGKVEFKQSKDFKCQIAELTYKEKVLLVKPLSYYNNAGEVVNRIVNYYKIVPPSDLLVIHDELMLDVGVFRVRQKGRDAGNNGIKNIISHVGENFHRMRVGVNNDKRQFFSAEDFVLNNFSKEELDTLKNKIAPHIFEYIYNFIDNKPDILTKTVERQ